MTLFATLTLLVIVINLSVTLNISLLHNGSVTSFLSHLLFKSSLHLFLLPLCHNLSIINAALFLLELFDLEVNNRSDFFTLSFTVNYILWDIRNSLSDEQFESN